MTRPRARRRRGALTALAVVAVSASAVGLAPTSAFAARADVICASDSCDGNEWQRARGDSNERSYWGMDPGHNCTNYVAWRLVRDGVTRPPTNPGNAATWADRALADGFRVDSVPEPGAIAQWDAGAAGYTEDGHVAYVERVTEDGRIVVSEDFWFGGSQTGELTYRVVDPSTVSHFIHYGDRSAALLRITDAIGGQWATLGTGIDPQANRLSALTLSGAAAVVTATADGRLSIVEQRDGAWVSTDTGLVVDGTFAAVDMGTSAPYVMAVDHGQLVMVVRTATGWLRMPLGVAVSGPIAAVDLGGLWPTVYTVQDGVLVEVWGDTAGWHSDSTGIPAVGPLAAATNALGWPEVFWIANGRLQRAWADELGWQTEDTGLAASGPIGAALVGATVQAAVTDPSSGVLAVAVRDAATGVWTPSFTGMRPGALLAALPGPAGPRLIQVG